MLSLVSLIYFNYIYCNAAPTVYNLHMFGINISLSPRPTELINTMVGKIIISFGVVYSGVTIYHNTNIVYFITVNSYCFVLFASLTVM